MEQFPQGNVPLRHLLNEETLFMSWRRSVIKEVNDFALRTKISWDTRLMNIQYISYHLAPFFSGDRDVENNWTSTTHCFFLKDLNVRIFKHDILNRYRNLILSSQIRFIEKRKTLIQLKSIIFWNKLVTVWIYWPFFMH